MAALSSQYHGPLAKSQDMNGINNDADPFANERTPPNPSHHRFSAFDTHLFALSHPSASPTQAKKALEAHLAETDRRIQETSKLGTTLVQQRVNLSQRIRDVETQDGSSKIGPELRQKLVDIEREYNEVGRQSAKAFLGQKSDTADSSSAPFALDGRNNPSPTKFSSQATDSPSKVSVPRKERNQTSNKEDIEFAAEITTSLLGQVRHLQAVLAERDESLKTANADKSKLELDAEGFAQRLKQLDDSEQRYRDENWTLETQVQDLQNASREAASRENKLQQALANTTTDKSSAQRELDDLRTNHGRVIEEYGAVKKSHDSELASLRKDANLAEMEKGTMQRKIEELTSQNQELVRGLSGRFRDDEDKVLSDHDSSFNEDSLVLSEREASPPPSPTKGGQRHSMLESETLKSSLHHAHRMIQSLKGNVHKEKAEKSDLKRMLQEARDELEMRRLEPNEKRLKARSQSDMRKTARSGFGAVRSSRTDILLDPENDPEWESGGDTPSRDSGGPGTRQIKHRAAAPLGDSSDAYQTANETEDAFETANERDTTDNDAFETGTESIAGHSTDEATETEGVGRTGTIRAKRPTLPDTGVARNRNSVQSTASTSDDDDDYAMHTPVQGQPQRFRLKMNRNSRRSRIGNVMAEGSPSTARGSPASLSHGAPEANQSLASELENLSGDDDGTPGKRSIDSPRSSHSLSSIRHKPSSTSLRTGSQPSPSFRPSTVIYNNAPPVPRIPMVDSGTMTEPDLQLKAETGAIHDDRSTPATVPSSALPKSAAASITSRIFGVSPSTPQNKFQNKGLDAEAATQSVQGSASTSASTPPRPVWDQPLHMFSGSIPGMDQSSSSTPLSSRTTSQAIEPPREITHDDRPLHGTPQRLAQQGPAEIQKDVDSPALALSPIRSVETAPAQQDPVPNVGHHADLPMADPTKVPEATAAAKGAATGGMLGSVFGWHKSSAASITPVSSDETAQARSDVSADGKNISVPKDISPENPVGPQNSVILESPKQFSVVPKADQSSQTLLSAEQIDSLLNRKEAASAIDARNTSPPPSMKPLAEIGAVVPPHVKTPEVRIPEGSYKDSLGKSFKRPVSISSMRSRSAQYPPLPPDHQEAIAAAAEKTTSIMGPPIAPASAYPSRSARSRPGSRPQTPSQQGLPSPSSKGGTTPRQGRYSTARSQVSRRSSVSSFASELDQRFNIRTDGMPMPQGFNGNTDPRMIQAITQTMIGEMMWKYTRKAGRGEMSNTRHRRFFWVHPYTRTLYWSDRDPASANRAELKSKSVAIEAVRVVSDDNPMPPGLHRKSIIIVTPGRSVKFTAQTSQRHETWFNALSYLLLRTGADGQATSNPAGDLTDTDLEEFNPQYGSQRRSARSRVSMSSFRSQTNANRNVQSSLASRAPIDSLASRRSRQPVAEPSEDEKPAGSLRKRISRSLSRSRGSKALEQRILSAESGPTKPAASAASTNATTSRRSSVGQSKKPQHVSIGSRISNYWKPSDPPTMSSEPLRTRGSRTGSIVEPGVLEGGRSIISSSAGDSAEDLRRVIEHREGQGNLENVRACCEGQHDVGALRGANGRIHSHAGALTQDRRASSNSLTNLAYT